MDCEKIGKFIQELRKEKKVTQKDLADYLMVTVQAVSKWERGLGCPDLSFLQPIANYFEISINELLSGERIPQKEILEKVDDLLMKNLESMQEKRKKEIIFLISLFLILVFFFLILTSNLILSLKILLLIIMTILLGYLPTIIEKKMKLWHLAIFFCFILEIFGVDLLSTIIFKQNPLFYFHQEKTEISTRYDYPFYSIYKCSNQATLTGLVRKNPNEYCESYYSPKLEKSSSIQTTDGTIYYLSMKYSNQQGYLGKNSYTFNVIDLDTLYQQEFVKERMNHSLSIPDNLSNSEIEKQKYEIIPNSEGIHLFEEPTEFTQDIVTLQNYFTEKQFWKEITIQDLKDISLEKIKKEEIVELFNEAFTNTPNETQGFRINQMQNDEFQVIYMIENQELTHAKILEKKENSNLDLSILEKVEELMIGTQNFDVTDQIMLSDEYQMLKNLLEKMEIERKPF